MPYRPEILASGPARRGGWIGWADSRDITQIFEIFGWKIGGRIYGHGFRKEYYGTHSGQNTDAAHNELVGNHLQRIWGGKYQSKTEATADFYAKCLDSDLRKILDKKWVKK